MAFTNEGRLEQIRVWSRALESSTFKLGDSSTPSPASINDTRNVNGGMTQGSQVQTFSNLTLEPDFTNGTIRVNCIVPESEGNGFTWTEIGLFWPSGDLVSREVISAPEIKNNAKRLFYTFILEFYK